jgi:hypothetical protein
VERDECEGGSKRGLLQLERHERIKPARVAAAGMWSTVKRWRGRLWPASLSACGAWRPGTWRARSSAAPDKQA